MKVQLQENHSIPSMALYIFYCIGSHNERIGAKGKMLPCHERQQHPITRESQLQSPRFTSARERPDYSFCTKAVKPPIKKVSAELLNEYGAGGRPD